MFYAENSNQIFTVTNCTLPETFKIYTASNVSIYTRNAHASTSFIHGFILTEDGIYCNAGTDSVPGLTPYVPTQCQLCTCYFNRNNRQDNRFFHAVWV